MSDIIIQAENLSKFYRLGIIGSTTLKDDVSRWWAMLRGKPDPTLRVDQVQESNDDNNDYVWALKDVSFEVKQGEVLGIIGRNGAGKSTLLKILSRVTAPTSGECRVKGRIASLLEVGTGFHPELTGRENIFLNGAILGMTKDEIRKKFDEIVAFSEVEKYIDTPVKRYSSGMYVRLAFAVAAHLEPEILVVDEVLAVGDAEFQKKCLGKMGDVAKEGKTVLFVSHNMAAVASLCSISVLLEGGCIKQHGPTNMVVSSYMSSGSNDTNEVSLLSHPNRTFGHKQLLTKIRLDLEKGNVAFLDWPLRLKIDYDFPNPITTPQFVVIFYNNIGVRIFSLISDYQENNIPVSLKGRGSVACQIERLPLLPGNYFIKLQLWTPSQKLDEVDNVIALNVEWLNRDIGQFKWDGGMGVVYVNACWELL